MSISTVSRKGQVVIPRDVREALGIRPGDTLDFVLDGSGGISVRRAERIPLGRLRGAWKKPGDSHLTDADVSAAIMEAACRRRA
jgi:AbrB family looped-hinge helix DNA binding protein